MFGNIPARKILKFITSKRILLAAIVLGFLLSSHLASAEGYRSLVKIPGMPENPDVFEYLGGLYKFLMSAIGVVAMGAIVIGGARYLTSVGNPAAIEDAKHTIYSAITGLILALSTWVIISEINPDILVLKKPGMPWTWTGGRYEPAAKDPLAMCAPGPQGDGITTACSCADGKNDVWFVDKDKIATKLTFNISKNPAASGDTVVWSGKLSKADGSPISAAKQITIRRYDAGTKKSMEQIVMTDSAGNYSINTTVTCSTDPAGPEQIQAIFKTGDSAYGISYSDIINYTMTGGAVCLGYNLNILPIVGTGCKAICSNPSLAIDNTFHCAIAKLGVGRFLSDAEDGQNLLIEPPVKKGQPIFYDAHTDSKKLGVYPIGMAGVNLDSGFWSSVAGYQYLCVFDSRCIGILDIGVSMGCVKYSDDITLLTPRQDGKFFVNQTKTGTIAPMLTVYTINPNTGVCDIEKEDRGVLIEVIN